MPQIELQNQEQQTTRASSYNRKQWAKAGLVFAGTVGAFLTLKATGSFRLISSWLGFKSEVYSDNSKLAVQNNQPATLEHTIPRVEPELTTQKLTSQQITQIPKKIDSEFQVNTYTTSNQWYPAIAKLKDGKFIITWVSNTQDGSDMSIYGQLYNINNERYGDEFQVNTYTLGSQRYPSVSGLDDGKFIVTWESCFQDCDSGGSGWDIYGQLFHANSSRYGSEFQINIYSTFWQMRPSVAGLNDGKFIVVWQSGGDRDGDEWGVYGRLFYNNGLAYSSEFLVNTYITGSQHIPSVVTLKDGRFIVAWQSGHQDGDRYGIFAQIFSGDGTKYGTEFQVNTHITASQNDPSLSGVSDDNLAIVWNSYLQDGSEYGVYGQLYDLEGVKQFSEFQVNSYTSHDQGYDYDMNSGCYIDYYCGAKLGISDLTDGKFVVTWGSEGQDGSGYGVYGQLYNANGTRYGIEFQINTFTTGNQGYYYGTSVAGLNNGTFIVTWDSEGQDGSGYGVYGQLFSIEFNRLPLLTNHQLIIAFSSQIINLTPEMLSATDPDGNDADLIFIISNIQYGQFEHVNNPGIAITSFTQQDIIDGNVQFVRDDSDYLPTYEVSVSDGTLATEPSPVTITFSDVNNVPTLITNELPLYQGQTLTITQDMLYARDIENEPPDILFIISDMQYGHFERVGSLGATITRFTQQEINNGEILFIHDGSSTAPHFYVSVTDYTYTTTPELCNTQLLDVNDAPRFINNQLEVYQGQTVVITPAILSATDPDNNDADLVFTITDLQYGQFEDVSNPGVAITSFTQQNIIDSQIQFVQDGSSNTPFYTVTVSDGALSTSSTAIVTGIETISLVKNKLIISDSLQVVLSEAFLKATHITEDEKTLNFNASDIEHGHFALVTDIATPITEFLQDKVTNRQVYFAHDGSGIAPAYNISVSDGIYVTEPEAADVMFDTLTVVNDPPRLAINQLSIQEGASVVLDTNNLKGTDIDSLDANLIFIASGITNGQFENNPGVVITSFTQQQIINQQISFVHDGNEDAPSYSIQVSDGDQTTTPQAMTVTFTKINDAPVLSNPIPDRLAEHPNKPFSFTIPENTFTDAENDPLTLTAKMRNGDVYQPLPNWVEFDAANNRFSGTPVSLGNTRFSIFATDPHNATAQGDFSVQVVKPEGLSKGALGGIIAAAGLITSAVAGAGIWKYKNHRAELKRQKQHFLAERIRKHLNLNIFDFASEQGREYLSIIDTLIGKIEQRSISIKDMNNKELDALALQLASIIEDKIILQKACLRANAISLDALSNMTETIANTVSQPGSRGSIAMQTFMRV